MNLTIRPTKILTILIIIIISLEIANIIGLVLYFNGKPISWFSNLFDLNREANIPSYYSSITILFSSVLLGFIAFYRKKNGLKYILWLILSFIFFYLSLDESVQIHERLGTLFEGPLLDFTGYLSWGWVVPYGLLVIIFSIVYYFKFLAQLPKNIFSMFIISGSIYVIGAIGFEMLAAKNYESSFYSEILNAIYYSIEEFLEMLGIAIFVYSLLLYIKEEITIEIKKAA